MFKLYNTFKKKKNEKLETIRRREFYIDTVCGILVMPMLYILTVLVCAL